MSENIKQQNITIQNRLNEIQNINDTSNQKNYYLSLNRRYGHFLSILFIWLYWIIYIILLIALFNSDKISFYIKIIIGLIMFLYPFYRTVYNIFIIIQNFFIDLFIY